MAATDELKRRADAVGLTYLVALLAAMATLLASIGEHCSLLRSVSPRHSVPVKSSALDSLKLK